MNSEELWIQKSCETYILKKVPLLLSAFPGYLVFGQSDRGQKYEELKCLKFHYYDYAKLSDSITKCVTFIANDIEETEAVIINENQNITYLWQGILKTVNNVTEKKIKFIVTNGFERNELIFSLIEFNNLISVLKRCLISSLCLKDEEEIFFSELIKKDNEFIRSCKNTLSVAHDFIETYLKTKCIHHSKKASYIELICYYNDIFLVLKNLDQIFCDEEAQN
jgi:hypothetical protein